MDDNIIQRLQVKTHLINALVGYLATLEGDSLEYKYATKCLNFLDDHADWTKYFTLHLKGAAIDVSKADQLKAIVQSEVLSGVCVSQTKVTLEESNPNEELDVGVLKFSVSFEG